MFKRIENRILLDKLANDFLSEVKPVKLRQKIIGKVYNLIQELLSHEQKETAKDVVRLAIRISDMSRDTYQFQKDLMDLIKTIYGVETIFETIIPAQKQEVQDEQAN